MVVSIISLIDGQVCSIFWWIILWQVSRRWKNFYF